MRGRFESEKREEKKLSFSLFHFLSLFFILGIFMSRSRKWRKRFGCGHRGYGQFCHCCGDREARLREKVVERRESKQVRHEARQIGGWDLSKFPKAIFGKVRKVLTSLGNGVSPGELGGKRFGFAREVMRIPIGYRHRLLCRWDQDGVEPLELLTHEDYNARVRRKNWVS